MSAFGKLIGYLWPLLLNYMPQIFGNQLTPDAMAGALTFGPALAGILTNGIGGSLSAIFTNITGLLPFVIWLILTIAHITIAPALMIWIAVIATVIIAKLDNITDIPSMLQWAFGKLFPNKTASLKTLPAETQ